MTFTRETTIGKRVYTMDDVYRLYPRDGRLTAKDMEQYCKKRGLEQGMATDLMVVAMLLRRLVADDYWHTYIHAQQTASKYPLGNFQKMPASEKQRCYESGIRHACQFLEAGCPEPSYEHENHYAAFEWNYKMFERLSLRDIADNQS